MAFLVKCIWQCIFAKVLGRTGLGVFLNNRKDLYIIHLQYYLYTELKAHLKYL